MDNLDQLAGGEIDGGGFGGRPPKLAAHDTVRSENLPGGGFAQALAPGVRVSSEFWSCDRVSHLMQMIVSNEITVNARATRETPETKSQDRMALSVIRVEDLVPNGA
jgi:hypothetical protein